MNIQPFIYLLDRRVDQIPVDYQLLKVWQRAMSDEGHNPLLKHKNGV